MILRKKVIVVMPAYNAGQTLEQTYSEIPFDIVDEIVLVDDKSHDNTVQIAERLGIKHIIVHDRNKGYGGNQKTCYDTALQLGADIIIMVHPDYQYTPKLIPSMAYLIANEVYPAVLGSRILGRGAIEGGMPRYKYIGNRILTLIQNILVGEKLSEYHTGYRAFSRTVLETINYQIDSDDFVFDNQMLSQIIFSGFKIAEITCPTKYFPEASSINISRGFKYALGVLITSIRHFAARTGFIHFQMYLPKKSKDILKENS